MATRTTKKTGATRRARTGASSNSTRVAASAKQLKRDVVRGAKAASAATASPAARFVARKRKKSRW